MPRGCAMLVTDTRESWKGREPRDLSRGGGQRNKGVPRCRPWTRTDCGLSYTFGWTTSRNRRPEVPSTTPGCPVHRSSRRWLFAPSTRCRGSFVLSGAASVSMTDAVPKALGRSAGRPFGTDSCIRSPTEVPGRVARALLFLEERLSIRFSGFLATVVSFFCLPISFFLPHCLAAVVVAASQHSVVRLFHSGAQQHPLVPRRHAVVSPVVPIQDSTQPPIQRPRRPRWNVPPKNLAL
mmetsp:Transcript_22689/g.48142  ORF Transcript_22689/g.48142 Transcript_22689/m.48142 type:complete len:237 (-) Transcript_22689:127-837(-)